MRAKYSPDFLAALDLLLQSPDPRDADEVIQAITRIKAKPSAPRGLNFSMISSGLPHARPDWAGEYTCRTANERFAISYQHQESSAVVEFLILNRYPLLGVGD